MAESNGGGRLDRLEGLLERMGERLDKVATMGYLHDERLSRIESSLEAESALLQTESAGRIAKDSVLDARVDKLVSSIGEFIARLPIKI